MTATEIVLERETANDESAVVVTIHVRSGAAVRKDDVIFDIENSKATQEVLAPEDGILSHDLKVGQSVAFGLPIARVVPAEEWAPAPARQPAILVPAGEERAAAPPPAKAPEAEPRFSRAAASLIAEHGLARNDFGTDFVTARDVRAKLGTPQPQPVHLSVVSSARAEVSNETRGLPVERRKRAEIEVLSSGAGGTMLSVLGATIGPLEIAREPGDFLEGRITDLVIYEASRLVRKHPRLNASYADGRVLEHEAVHAGLAIDSGGRLMVYGIENADRATLPALHDAIADAVSRYMSDQLTSAELSRATFTVTDLSADRLDFVLPLLPRGQSCILGITHSPEAGFRIFAGFDHRVTEGREVGLFLTELRDRLLSFAVAQPGTAVAAACAFCGRSLAEAVGRSKTLGLLKVLDGNGQDSLCCASCWNGW